MAKSREEIWHQVSAMAGYDEEGNLLPPSNVGGIDRSKTAWRVREYQQPSKQK
jgi:hypothetical protein